MLELFPGNSPPAFGGIDLEAPDPGTGSPVTVIASAVDPDDDSLSVTGLLKTRPVGSSTTLASSDGTATFTPDAQGTKTIRCTVGDGIAQATDTIHIAAVSPRDTTTPSVSQASPADGAMTVAVTADVCATFNESMDASPISTATVSLRAGMAAVAGAAIHDAGTTTAVFNPTSSLGSTMVYTATIETGAADAAGNLLALAFGWSFTMADAVPPGNVTVFTATAGNGQAAPSWTNPTDADFSGVKGLPKTGGAPLSPTDGTAIFDALGTGCTHAGASKGTPYCCRAFAYDASGNFASGVSANAAPNAPPDPVTNLMALPGFTDTLLTRQNPPAVNGVRVVRKLSGFPTSPTDGTQGYDGAATSATSTVLTSGNTYYYAVSAYQTGVCSTAATKQATAAMALSVDPDGNGGRYLSLEVGENDAVHMSCQYCQDLVHCYLKHATNRAGTRVNGIIPDTSADIGRRRCVSACPSMNGANPGGGVVHVPSGLQIDVREDPLECGRSWSGIPRPRTNRLPRSVGTGFSGAVIRLDRLMDEVYGVAPSGSTPRIYRIRSPRNPGCSWTAPRCLLPARRVGCRPLSGFPAVSGCRRRGRISV